jgi:hypothetical protein
LLHRMPTPAARRGTAARRRTHLSTAAGLLALLTACGLGDWPGPTAGSEVELSGLALFQEDELLHDVRDVLVDGSGQVWVLSGMQPYVRAYTPDGRLRRRFGRNGKGPGEISNPWSLFPTGDAAAPIGVWDVGARKLKAYTPDGVPGSSRDIEVPANLVRADMSEITYGSVDALRGWGADLLLQDEPRGVTHPFHILYSRLLRLDSMGTVVDTVVDFSKRYQLQIRRLGAARVMVPLPLWTTCPDHSLVFLDPFAPALVWYDPAGRQSAVTRLPPVHRRIDARDRHRYLANMIRLELQGQGVNAREIDRRATVLMRSFRSWFPEQAPPAVDLLCDTRGNAWLQQFSTEESPLGYGPRWLVVDRAGKRRLVRFPPGYRPRVFTHDAVIGIHIDSLDVQRLARVGL